MPNPVTHFEIIAKDASKLQNFYREIFGWTINADNPMKYGMVDTATPGKGIGGGIADPQPGGPGGITFYIEVADIDKTLAQLTKVGGKLAMPKMAVPNGPTIAQFVDPAGNRIGLVQSGSM